jgi:hypothetical protein
MNIDRIAPVLAVLISLIAIFAPMEYWAPLLLLVGVVHGVMSPVSEHSAQAMIYAAVVAVPIMGNSAEAIPGIGSYANSFLATFAVAVSGYAIATLAMDIKRRVQG